MAEKEKLKKVGILIKRERTTVSKVIATTGFKLRIDRGTGLLDVFLEVVGGQKGERVIVDPTLLLSNLDSFKKYVASLVAEQDDLAQKEEILVSDHSHFVNIIHFSNLGLRAETVFGVFSFHDWVDASRAEGGQKQEISSFDSLAVFSSSGLQKKLLLELLVTLGQLAKER